jgi:hypothetical protein
MRVHFEDMDDRGLHRRLRELERPCGDRSGCLRLGHHGFRLQGIDAELDAALRERWGPFYGSDLAGEPAYTLELFQGDERAWLDPPRYGERYRIDSFYDAEHRVTASYHFALCENGARGAFRVGLTEQQTEPRPRVVENAVRFLAARMAVERGGFALHGAAFLLSGRAHVYAGPSGSGKTTAMGLTRGATSLGDDFAIVLPGEDGWTVPALPFDNTERVSAEPPSGLQPLVGIWRLRKSEQTRLVGATQKMAAASLLGCTAFPWAMPERAVNLLENAKRYVSQGRFGDLHFRRDSDLAPLLSDEDGDS